jgi:uncharacterized protein (TIGR00730 family)
MKRQTRIITVFGSSRPSQGDARYAQAMALGAALARKGFLVCSGGYAGTMEAVSRGAKEAGGQTLAVTAQCFRARANRWVDQEIRVETWQERLFELVNRGRGYIACPGGTGTLAELAVVWEMMNKGAMRSKPLVVLGSFWQPIIDRVREVERRDRSSPGERSEPTICVASSPARAAAYVATHFTMRAAKRRSARSSELPLSP